MNEKQLIWHVTWQSFRLEYRIRLFHIPNLMIQLKNPDETWGALATVTGKGGRATVKGSVWGEYQFQVVLQNNKPACCIREGGGKKTSWIYQHEGRNLSGTYRRHQLSHKGLKGNIKKRQKNKARLATFVSTTDSLSAHGTLKKNKAQLPLDKHAAQK